MPPAVNPMIVWPVAVIDDAGPCHKVLDDLGLQTVMAPSLRKGRLGSVTIVDLAGSHFVVVATRSLGTLRPPLPWWRRIGKGLVRTQLTLQAGPGITATDLRALAIRAMMKAPDLWREELRKVRGAATHAEVVESLAEWKAGWPWPPWDREGKFT